MNLLIPATRHVKQPSAPFQELSFLQQRQEDGLQTMHALKYLKLDTTAPYHVPTSLLTRCSQAVKAHPLVLFMKGVPEAPQCGFSRTVAKVLEIYEVPPEKVKTYNVLEDPELRTAIKEFSYVFTTPGAEFINSSSF